MTVVIPVVSPTIGFPSMSDTDPLGKMRKVSVSHVATEIQLEAVAILSLQHKFITS